MANNEQRSASSSESVLILGGGFAGLFAALHLSKLACPLPIKLVDAKARFVFKPLLYELLSNEVEADLVWPHYRDILPSSDVTHILDSVKSIDLRAQQVELASGATHGYRYLVVALGDTAGYFDIPGAQANAFTFRTAEDAVKLREHLRHKLQAASQTPNEAKRKALLSVAIVGAGPSGVELSATLADLLPNWYHELGGQVEDLQLTLLQRSAEVLEGSAGDEVRDIAQKALSDRQVPVKLLLEASVQAIEPGALTYRHGDEDHDLKAETIIWTAGSATHPLMKSLPIEAIHRDFRDRPYLTEVLQLIGYPNVFAGGDCAVDVSHPYPATAQVAYQQGLAIAQSIQAFIEGRKPEPANVSIRGALMKLGLEASVAEIMGQIRISGRVGHLIRQATYLSVLPTSTSKLKLGAEWINDEIFEPFLDA